MDEKINQNKGKRDQAYLNSNHRRSQQFHGAVPDLSRMEEKELGGRRKWW
jgi:hypothetical protein